MTVDLSDPLVLGLLALGLSLLVLLLVAKRRKPNAPYGKGDRIMQAFFIPGLVCVFLPIYQTLGTLERLVEWELTLMDMLLLLLPLVLFVIATRY